MAVGTGDLDHSAQGSSASTRALVLPGTSTGAPLLTTLAIPLTGLALVSAWVVSSYAGIAPTELLSFPVADGWCDVATEGVGSHCFGDFSLVNELFANADPWNSEMSGIASWPALAWMPAYVIWHLGALTGAGWVAPVLFALLTAAALLTPAWWAARQGTGATTVALLTLAGVATTPFIVTVDRGNPVGLAVPLLMWAAVSFARRRWSAMTVAVVLASLLKPQLALLLLLPLTHRQYLHALAGAAGSVLATVAGFLVFPQHFPANVIGWARSLLARTGDYQPLDQVYPYNIGIGRSLVSAVDASGLGHLIGAAHRLGVEALVTAASPVLLAGALLLGTLALWLGRDRLSTPQAFGLASLVCLYTSGTVYLYYVAVLLVVLAMLYRDPGPADAAQTARPETVTSVVLSLALAPVLVPVPGTWFGTSIVPYVSLWQVLVGPLLLVWFGWLVVRGLDRRRHPRTAAPVQAAETGAGQPVDAG